MDGQPPATAPWGLLGSLLSRLQVGLTGLSLHVNIDCSLPKPNLLRMLLSSCHLPIGGKGSYSHRLCSCTASQGILSRPYKCSSCQAMIEIKRIL